MSYRLIRDPSPPPVRSLADNETQGASLIALDIETKYEFRETDADVAHQYLLPSDRDIQNCGGYIDKLLQFRDPKIIEFLCAEAPTLERLRASHWPVLRGRSPHIDLILLELIAQVRQREGSRRVSLLDHGCSVAEHFDFLDLLFRATRSGRATELLSYVGLDVSPLVLSAAKLFHQPRLGENFRLILSEGSNIGLPDDSMDLSMSVGVINHVVDPLHALNELVRVTRFGFVCAIWVTNEPKGFWAINHSGISNYFFAERDLADVAHAFPKGAFYSAEFVPEHDSTQPASYVGLTEERLRRMGSYILVYSTFDKLPPSLHPVMFEAN